MKQSSIEWLFEKLFDSFEKFNNGEITFSEYLSINLELRAEAKEMHKQEVIDAHDNGYIDGGNKKTTTSEQYYNETYNIKR